MHNSTYTIILLSETFQANCLCVLKHTFLTKLQLSSLL